jgi:hypothetical protein
MLCTSCLLACFLACLQHLFDRSYPHLLRAISKANAEAANNSRGSQQPIMEVHDSEPFETIRLAQ